MANITSAKKSEVLYAISIFKLNLLENFRVEDRAYFDGDDLVNGNRQGNRYHSVRMGITVCTFVWHIYI